MKGHILTIALAVALALSHQAMGGEIPAPSATPAEGIPRTATATPSAVWVQPVQALPTTSLSPKASQARAPGSTGPKVPRAKAPKPPPEGLDASQLASLRCRCCGRVGPTEELIARLERLQRAWGTRLNFTSGGRCASHNARVGGVKRSRHLRGEAADVAVPASKMSLFTAAARATGFRRVLTYPKRGYVHLSL